jgi:hypothetical protein
MRGYFTTPTIFVVDGKDITVKLACVIPALYCITHEYEFSSRDSGNRTYLNRFLRWRPRWNQEVACILYAGEMQLVPLIRNPAVKQEQLGKIRSTAPQAIAWRDFKELELLRQLTGEWQLHPPAVVACVRNKDYRSLVVVHQIDVDPAVIPDELEEPVMDDIRVYRLLWDLIAEEGPTIDSSRVAKIVMNNYPGVRLNHLYEDGAIVIKEDKTLTFGWIDALISAAPKVIGSYVAPVEVVQEKYPQADIYPRFRQGGTLICPVWLPISALNELKVSSVIICGDPQRSQHGHMRKKDLMAVALGKNWLNVSGDPWYAPALLAAKFPSRSGSISKLMERNTHNRFLTLLNHFKKSGDEEIRYTQRFLIVFTYNDPAERERYESSAFATGPNLICVAKPPADFQIGSIVSVFQGKKGPNYKYKGRRLDTLLGAVMEPFTMCFAHRLTSLVPEDFDVVILLGDSATPKSFVHEAMRVGSKGTTVLCGVE